MGEFFRTERVDSPQRHKEHRGKRCLSVTQCLFWHGLRKLHGLMAASVK